MVELGAGRGEMAEAFSEWRYMPVDIDSGALPASFRGVVFSNEFFDALPVEAAVYRGGAFHCQLVNFDGARFVWHEGPEVDAAQRRLPAPLFPGARRGPLVRSEPRGAAAGWSASATRSVDGYVLTIDYGYTRAEAVRFPAGTLMGYRRHTAREDVLEDPGERDITAHVNFTALEEHGERCGLRNESFETLAQMLLTAGEPDQFAAALGPGDDCAAACSSRRCCSAWARRFGCCCKPREKGNESEGKA